MIMPASVLKPTRHGKRKARHPSLPARVLLAKNSTAMENQPPTPPPLPKQARFGDTVAERMLLPVGRSGWAIAAGYLGLFSLIVLPAPIALIISIIAIRDIRKSRTAAHPKHGMGRAIFGLIMGILGTAILVVIICANLMQAGNRY
jgi:hypothetical protein